MFRLSTGFFLMYYFSIIVTLLLSVCLSICLLNGVFCWKVLCGHDGIKWEETRLSFG